MPNILGAQPAPGYGDSIGGMTIAGGILGALYHRERTGEAISVDVSLLGVGMWAMSPAIALSLQMGHAWRPGPGGSVAPFDPLVGTYQTQDGRFLAFSCLQGFHYWPAACRAVGREDLIDDERFASHELLAANAGAARDILVDVSNPPPSVNGAPDLRTSKGSGRLLKTHSRSWKTPRPWQMDTSVRPRRLTESPTASSRPPCNSATHRHRSSAVPKFNEHCDEILASIGCNADEVIELKVAGVVARRGGSGKQARFRAPPPLPLDRLRRQSSPA